jgi:hypothetical protein
MKTLVILEILPEARISSDMFHCYSFWSLQQHWQRLKEYGEPQFSQSNHLPVIYEKYYKIAL